jgi:hypothetical protein
MTTEAETTVDRDDSAGADAELAAWNEDDAGSTSETADAEARAASGTAANAPATSGAKGAKGGESGAGRAEKKTALQLAEERAASKQVGTTSPATSDGGRGPAPAAAAASGTDQTATAKAGEPKKAEDAHGQGKPAAAAGSLSDRIKAAVKSVLDTHKNLVLLDPSPEDANATTTLANLHAEMPAISQMIALHAEVQRDNILSEVRALLGGDEAGGGVQQLREQLQAVQEQLGRERLFGALRSEEYGMPDAERIVEDSKFLEWLGKQTPGMQGLAHSPDPEDAAALLRAYKESTGTKSGPSVHRRSIRSSRAASGDGRVQGGDEVDLQATFDQTEV